MIEWKREENEKKKKKKKKKKKGKGKISTSHRLSDVVCDKG